MPLFLDFSLQPGYLVSRPTLRYPIQLVCPFVGDYLPQTVLKGRHDHIIFFSVLHHISIQNPHVF